MIDDAVMAEIRKTFVSCSVTDAMTLETMRETYEQSGCKGEKKKKKKGGK